jgi:hypothetical protein
MQQGRCQILPLKEGGSEAKLRNAREPAALDPARQAMGSKGRGMTRGNRFFLRMTGKVQHCLPLSKITLTESQAGLRLILPRS